MFLTWRGKGIGVFTCRVAIVKSSGEIRRHGETAGEDVFSALGLGHEGDGIIIHLVAKVG